MFLFLEKKVTKKTKNISTIGWKFRRAVRMTH